MQRTLLLAAVLLLFASCAETPPPGINVIPRPVSVEPGDGVFRIGRSCRIGYDDPALQSVAGLCAGYLAEAGVRKPVVTDKPVHRGVDLQLDATLAGEAYALSVTPRGVTVCGGSSRAVLYGVQTLRQLVDGGRVPVVEIRDEPCFGYRGAMFDVARYFYPVEDVKRFIDIMALHKLNTFHWHLTDDQGWRIEIRRYPELTRVGSVRRETLIGHYKTSDRYDGTPHGGYYTQDEIREVVAYAAERCIEVIPEIELPGHSMAALASYPWLGCTKGPYEVRTTWFYSSDVLCAGRETTFEFLENVLAEVLELFPSKYIHIGGDECPKVRWEKCPDCRRRIRQEGLKDGDDLQSYFVSRIEKWLHARGREMIGWDELLEGGVTPSTIVMSWRREGSRPRNSATGSSCPRGFTSTSTITRPPIRRATASRSRSDATFRSANSTATTPSMSWTRPRAATSSASRPTCGPSTSPRWTMRNTCSCRVWRPCPRWHGRPGDATTTISCGGSARCAGCTTVRDTGMPISCSGASSDAGRERL